MRPSAIFRPKFGSGLLVVCCFLWRGAAAAAPPDVSAGQRIESRDCTIWLESGITPQQVNRQVRAALAQFPQATFRPSASPEEQLAATCDVIFQRAQTLLDMRPPDLRVNINIARSHDRIRDVHAAHYGFGTEAIAFYLFEDNTIYTTGDAVSASVLAHEMAHCIIDHYFGIRPPRKIEELLAIYVDEHLHDR